MKKQAEKAIKQAREDIVSVLERARDKVAVEAEPGELLVAVTKCAKHVEETRKAMTAGLRGEVKEIDAAFKEMLSPILGVKEALQARVIELQEAAEREARIEAEKQAKETIRLQAEEDADAVVEGRQSVIVSELPRPAPPGPIRAGGAAVSIPTTWDVEVIDVDKIPREWMVPDLVALRAHARARKEGFDVPGIRAFKKRGTSVR